MMRIFKGAFLATAAVVGVASTALAADLPYKVAPPPVLVTVYNWSGFYGGVYGGSSFTGNGAIGITGDPTSVAYNGLALNGTGQVSNTIIPGGVNCALLVNCNIGGPAATSITPNANPGYRMDSLFPASTTSPQMRGLFGAELGARAQFDHFVLGIGADFTWFTKDKGTNVTALGSFYNSNGFTANSQAVGCIVGALGTCNTAQFLNTSGSVITVNSGGYAANLAIQSNPDWVGTVRGSVGYAFDRLLLTASGGLAYAPGSLKVSGTYNDRFTSACSGVTNVYTANANSPGTQPGQSFVGYQCGAAAVNLSSVSQLTTTSINYSGSHGGMLMGFAGGFGTAYALTDHISLTFESMYYNLGTVSTTVTGAGTQTTTTVASGTVGLPVASPGSVVTTTAALAGPPILVSRVIDGYVFRGGVQLRF